MNERELQQQLAALVTQERAQLERLEKEGKADMADPTEREQYDKRATEIDETQQKLEAAQKIGIRRSKLAEREAMLEKFRTSPERGGKGEPIDERVREAFSQYIRTGDVTLARALVKSDDTKGGYLVPKEMLAEILKTETEFCPFRSLARIRQTSFSSVQVPKRTGVFSAAWTTESGTRSETTGLTYGMEEIPTHELYAMVDVSAQSLEDSAIDLEGEVQGEAAERFAVAETTAFMTGSGVGKPWGVTVDTAITDTNSGSNGDFDADDLIDLLYSLKGAYVNRATWLFNRVTLRKIRKLKANSEYIWSPQDTYPNNITQGLPGNILGRPYMIAPEMSDTGTTGAISVIVGDFGRGYLIVDRVQMSMLRDPYTQAASGNIRFWFRKRVGGQVVMSEAIKRLKEST